MKSSHRSYFRDGRNREFPFAVAFRKYYKRWKSFFRKKVVKFWIASKYALMWKFTVRDLFSDSGLVAGYKPLAVEMYSGSYNLLMEVVVFY